MPNLTAIAIINKGLTEGVMHPGDKTKDQAAKMLMPLPGFRNSGLPPEQAAHFAKEAGLPDSDAAKLYAEALTNLLETEGLEVVSRADLEQLRAQVATPQDASPAAPMIAVHCTCNRTDPLLDLTTSRAIVIADGAALRRRLDEVCTCPT